jgi:hypothetical protein
MPNAYASGNATLQREFDVRTQVISVVRTFIAGRPWRDLVPFQRQGLPTFAFLFGEAEDISDFSDSDDPEHDEAAAEEATKGSAPAAGHRQRS